MQSTSRTVVPGEATYWCRLTDVCYCDIIRFGNSINSMEGEMHLGMMVGVLMIVMMMLPMCCCKVSDEHYQKIMERHERLTKKLQNATNELPKPIPKEDWLCVPHYEFRSWIRLQRFIHNSASNRRILQNEQAVSVIDLLVALRVLWDEGMERSNKRIVSFCTSYWKFWETAENNWKRNSSKTGHRQDCFSSNFKRQCCWQLYWEHCISYSQTLSVCAQPQESSHSPSNQPSFHVDGPAGILTHQLTIK